VEIYKKDDGAEEIETRNSEKVEVKRREWMEAKRTGKRIAILHRARKA
jgi:hypothetical protein